MIVTITGAYRNAGDHLIGHRARTLLSRHVDDDIVNLDRRDLPRDAYEVMNRASAVFLTGGPAYQPGLYPSIYPIELERLSVPVVPFGLGWKGKLGQEPENADFTEESQRFLRALHADETTFSSARCELTERMVRAYGITNVRMTGCPAWYDEALLEHDITMPARVRGVVVTAPAVPQPVLAPLLTHLAKRFPRSRRTLAFQAGIESTHSTRSVEYSRAHRRSARWARFLGYRVESFESNLDAMMRSLDAADLHIGYRVHSHLYSLSQRRASLLIAEDSRGLGQNSTLGLPELTTRSSIDDVVEQLDALIDSGGATLEPAVATTRTTFPVMTEFLGQFR